MKTRQNAKAATKFKTKLKFSQFNKNNLLLDENHQYVFFFIVDGNKGDAREFS